MVGFKRQQYEHERDVALAWRVAALSRQEKLPKLETLLSQRSPRQTAREQRGQLQVLSEMYGIPLRKAKT